MCLACEQDSIWLAYLESKGLLKADDPAAIDALFSAFPVQPLPVQPEWDAPTPDAPNQAVPGQAVPSQAVPSQAAAKPAADNPFSCDDPTTK